MKSDNGKASVNIYRRNVYKINIFFGKYSSTYDSSTSLENKLMVGINGLIRHVYYYDNLSVVVVDLR